jgi:diguanylate cyclase (GGDEF)-like protein
MKLARYKLFVNYVRRDLNIAAAVGSLAFYRSHDKRWFDEQDKVIDEDDEIVGKLEKTCLVNEPWRERKSLITYFPIPTFGAVIIANFKAPPKKPTTIRLGKRISECKTGATNEFDATHDHLTGLFNRARLDQQLKAELEQAGRLPANEAALESTHKRGSVALIAFDIDFFKQVNDTFGHGYGDVVLRCLAERVEAVCAEQTRRYGDRIRVVPARSGGEEFVALLGGAFTLEEEWQIAEAIRSAVELRSLPSEDEWSQIERDRGLPDRAIFPPASERKLTISVGIASIRAPFIKTDVDQLSSTLKTQADTALYRAKSAGRNRSVAFRSIMNRYGRVLEHHPETKLVAIDLGQKVGVREGQEFLVYHPTFSGSEAFLLRDGRTQKRLGTYPSVTCGRIEVFNVQAEIAFCRVTANSLPSLFPVGSVLEAVPLGSISHLISNVSGPEDAISQQTDLQLAINRIVDAGETPTACVVDLTNAEQIAGDYGTAYVNRVLADILERVRAIFPRGSKIAQISPTQFGIVLPAGVTLTRDQLQTEIVEHAIANFYSGIKLIVGMFGPNEAARLEQEGIEPPQLRGAIELAQFAVVGYRVGGSGVALFSRYTPSAVLYASRNANNLGNLVRDYEALVRLGLRNVDMENQLALAYLENNQLNEATKAIDRALEFEPSSPTIWLNGALIRFRTDDLAGAIGCYQTAMVKTQADQFKLKNPYLANMAGLHVRALREEVPGVSLEATRDLVIEALADPGTSERYKARFREALLYMDGVQNGESEQKAPGADLPKPDL